jgi:hypothetical protein
MTGTGMRRIGRELELIVLCKRRKRPESFLARDDDLDGSVR